MLLSNFFNVGYEFLARVRAYGTVMSVRLSVCPSVCPAR